PGTRSTATLGRSLLSCDRHSGLISVKVPSGPTGAPPAAMKNRMTPPRSWSTAQATARPHPLRQGWGPLPDNSASSVPRDIRKPLTRLPSTGTSEVHAFLGGGGAAPFCFFGIRPFRLMFGSPFLNGIVPSSPLVAAAVARLLRASPGALPAHCILPPLPAPPLPQAPLPTGDYVDSVPPPPVARAGTGRPGRTGFAIAQPRARAAAGGPPPPTAVATLASLAR